MLALGALLLRTGDAEQAELLLRRCVELRGQLLPKRHWQIAEAQSLLGACLATQQKYEQAEELLLQSLDILQQSRGAADPHTKTTRRRLADLYEAWARPQEAAKYRSTTP
jgi:serine/threonine-protein kinase